MLDGRMEGDNRPPATLRMTPMNFGHYPMPTGLSRIASRNLDNPAHVAELEKLVGNAPDAPAADEAGLVTFTPDDIDWADDAIGTAHVRTPVNNAQIECL